MEKYYILVEQKEKYLMKSANKRILAKAFSEWLKSRKESEKCPHNIAQMLEISDQYAWSLINEENNFTFSLFGKLYFLNNRAHAEIAQIFERKVIENEQTRHKIASIRS